MAHSKSTQSAKWDLTEQQGLELHSGKGSRLREARTIQHIRKLHKSNPKQETSINRKPQFIANQVRTINLKLFTLILHRLRCDFRQTSTSKFNQKRIDTQTD